MNAFDAFCYEFDGDAFVGSRCLRVRITTATMDTQLWSFKETVQYNSTINSPFEVKSTLEYLTKIENDFE